MKEKSAAHLAIGATSVLRLASLSLIPFLVGCGSLLPSLLPEPDRSVQVWDLQGPLTPCPSTPRVGVVAIEPLQSSPWLDSRQLAFRKGTYEVGYYQFALLAEPPADTIEAMLTRELSCASTGGESEKRGESDEERYRTDESTVGGSAVVRLGWKLLAFEHDARTHPGIARVVIAASLRAPRELSRGSREFSSEVPLTSYDARGAVEGLREASRAVISEISEWIAKEKRRLDAETRGIPEEGRESPSGVVAEGDGA